MRNNFNELTVSELLEKRTELKGELKDLRFESVTGHLENPKAIKNLKRQVAQINTLLTEYERGIRGGSAE